MIEFGLIGQFQPFRVPLATAQAVADVVADWRTGKGKVLDIGDMIVARSAITYLRAVTRVAL